MNLLRRRQKSEDTEHRAASNEAACNHRTLVPHWDSVADMGHDDRVSFYECGGCNARFTPAEAAGLLS